MNKVQKGFTLIELMIVIAIIGILAAIAIPQYQDYVTRSKLTEGLNLAAAAKTAVAETVQTDGHWGANGNIGAGNNSYGLPTDVSISGKYVLSVGVANSPGGANTTMLITITYNPATVGGAMVAGKNVLQLAAMTTAGGVAWACGYQTTIVDTKTISAVAGTTAPAKYLPANCR